MHTFLLHLHHNMTRQHHFSNRAPEVDQEEPALAALREQVVNAQLHLVPGLLFAQLHEACVVALKQAADLPHDARPKGMAWPMPGSSACAGGTQGGEAPLA